MKKTLLSVVLLAALLFCNCFLGHEHISAAEERKKIAKRPLVFDM